MHASVGDASDTTGCAAVLEAVAAGPAIFDAACDGLYESCPRLLAVVLLEVTHRLKSKPEAILRLEVDLLLTLAGFPD